MKSCILTTVILSLLLGSVSAEDGPSAEPSASAEDVRKWSDDTGDFSVDAQLLKVEGDKVVLKKTTGSVIRVPIARLSEADQQYLQSLSKPDEEPTDDTPATQSAAVPRDEKLAAELQKGSIVSIRADEQTVGSVLAQIEKATGNRVRILEEFGHDGEILSKRVSINLQKKPFWEAVDAVAAAAGVKFCAIKDGTLDLSAEGMQMHNVKVTGPTTIARAFQVYPGFDEFFDNAMIVIRLEPRFGEPHLRSYQAEITLEDGKQIEYKPDFIFNTSNIHTGELTLQIKPDLPEGTKKAQQIKLEARLAFPSEWQPFTLPPLGELVPKPVTVGKGTVLVTQAKLDDESSEWQMFEVELLAEGLAFELKDIVLLDGADNRVKSSGGGSFKQENQQKVSLSFPRKKISGDPGKCRLAFEVPGSGEKIIGPLEDLAPKSITAGGTIVRVTKAGILKQSGGGEDYEVRLEFEGFPVPGDEMVLVGKNAKPLKPHSYGGGGGLFQISFNPKQIQGKADSYRLRIQTPTKVTEHVLHATFNDVPLTKDE